MPHIPHMLLGRMGELLPTSWRPTLAHVMVRSSLWECAQEDFLAIGVGSKGNNMPMARPGCQSLRNHPNHVFLDFRRMEIQSCQSKMKQHNPTELLGNLFIQICNTKAPPDPPRPQNCNFSISCIKLLQRLCGCHRLPTHAFWEDGGSYHQHRGGPH